MRKLLTLLVLLVLPSCSLLFPTIPQTEFEFVCATLEVDCEELEIAEPTVVISRVVQRVGKYYGFYFPGEPYVFITITPGTKETIKNITVHEMTHYVLYESGNRTGRCHSEREARRVTDIYKGVPYDDSWEVRYNCKGGEGYAPPGPYHNH